MHRLGAAFKEHRPVADDRNFLGRVWSADIKLLSQVVRCTGLAMLYTNVSLKLTEELVYWLLSASVVGVLFVVALFYFIKPKVRIAINFKPVADTLEPPS